MKYGIKNHKFATFFLEKVGIILEAEQHEIFYTLSLKKQKKNATLFDTEKTNNFSLRWWKQSKIEEWRSTWPELPRVIVTWGLAIWAIL